jgi:ParB family transcriptional regulator, chromosome partitioning protein
MSAPRTRGLGRGLSALIPLPSDQAAPAQLVPVDQVRPSHEQMRSKFPADSMADLVESVREHGVLQPIIVRKVTDGFELIAGERRWRAAISAGFERIPAVVRESTRDDALLLGLVENLQREDLDPIEEARGIKRLIEQFGLTHEEAARRLGKHRVAVSQSLRLLNACPALISAAASRAVSAGHARALVGLPDHEAQERALKVVVGKSLSVRQTERWVRTYRPPALRRPRADEAGAAEIGADAIRESLGMPVRIVGTTRGRVVIEFSSRGQLEAIIARLTG